MNRLSSALLGALARPGCWAQPDWSRFRFGRWGVDARVRCDSRGVPHIRAHQDADLHFAAGFVQAHYRLWQMDLLRRTAQGRLAEIFGKAALDEDVRVRGLGLRKVASESLPVLEESTLASLDAFVAGVNAGIRRLARRGGLPPEFLLLRYRPAPWTAIDSLTVIKYLGFDLARNLRNELFRARLAQEHPDLAHAFAWPKYPSGIRPVTGETDGSTCIGPRPPITPVPGDATGWLERLPGEGTAGSNAWAVASERSANGRPILAGDPHVQLSHPSIWFQLGLAVDGAPPAYGVTVPGLPGLVCGANTELAWSITNATVDTQDVVIVTSGEDQPDWEERSVVRVRGAEPVAVTAAGGDGYVRLDLPGTPSGRTRLSWSGFVPSAEMDGCVSMWRATSYAEFKSALRGFGVPALTMVVACRDGTIAVKTAGAVPLRAPGSGMAPSATMPEQRLLAFDELPEAVDPPCGYLVSANQRILPDGAEPFLGEDWAGAYRAPLLDGLLADAKSARAEDFRRWQLDVTNKRAERVLPVIREALSRSRGLSGPAEICRDLLERWDARDEVDAVAPVVFGGLMRGLERAWIGGVLSAELTEWMPDLAAQTDHLLLDEEARAAVGIEEPLAVTLAEVLTRLCAELAREFGDDVASWSNGRVHRAADGHVLSGAVPALAALFGGQATALGASEYSVRLMELDRGTRRITAGAPWRFVTEFVPDGCVVHDVLRHGASGHPLSAHYDDQTAAHARGRLHRTELIR